MPQFSDDLFLGSAITVQGMDAYPAVSTSTKLVVVLNLIIPVAGLDGR